MSKNLKLRKCIVAVLLAFTMVASLLAAGIGNSATVNAATTKTIELIYTGTNENVTVYVDGMQTSSWADTYGPAADNGFTVSKSTGSDGYTHFTVTFDFDSIFKFNLQITDGSTFWGNSIWFSWEDISAGTNLTKYVYADGTNGTQAPTVDDGEDEGDDTPAGPTSTGTVTFVYVGSESGVTADNFWFYMDWAAGTLATTSSGNLENFSITKASTTVDGYSAVVLTGSNVESELNDMWLKFGYDSQIGDTLNLAFNGDVYYVTDESYSTTPPSDDDEPVETTQYTIDVHVYGQDASVSCWLIQTSGGTEVAWGTSKSGSGTLSGDWSDITFTFSSSVAYDRVGVWLDTNYKLDLNGTSCEMWIVPEAGTCYDNEADALAAAADPATSSTIIFHYKKTSGTMGGWVVGTWYTSAINGGWGSKDTVFTYEDDWGYVAVVKYSAVLNEIGFKFHRRAKVDGVANDWYKEDGDDRTVTLSNGFAEVWITQGKKAISYTCPAGATKFDASTATKFKNYRYLLIETAKGEKADLVFHYLREDGNYDKWSVGIWAEVTSGAWKDAQITQNAELDEYGAATYTVDLSEWPQTEIGFAVNYNNWEKKDYDADRYVDVSGVEAGEVLNVYLYEGDSKIYYSPKTDAIVEESTGLNADVVFHYSRTNADYEGWMVGLWCELADGSWLNDNVAFDGTDVDGFATVTIDLAKFESSALGFKLNKDNWAEEDGGDRSLDLTDINDGDIIDIYLYEGDVTVYFQPKAEEEPVVEEVVVSETDVVEEAPVEDTTDDSKGGCAGGCVGCTGCTGCAVMLPIFAAIIAGALIIFKKRA